MLCDGAMGTCLYSRGIFINRCYDELNLSRPELVRTIHEEYLQAGAEIIETNTFGANRFRLAHHGLQDRVFEINREGAALARQAATQIEGKQAARVWVAGAIGPLGTLLDPVGKVSLNEAFAAFSHQIRSLVAGGVDLLVIETVTALKEAEQALKAAHAVAPGLPIIVMFTVDEDANLLDGSTPELAAQHLEEWGADAIGCNCSVGPATVLTAIERIAAVTSLPIAAMPNAGMPRAVEGRNIYPSSPEHMASIGRKFLKAGVQFIGGCCAHHTNHIRAIKSAIHAPDAQQVSIEGILIRRKCRPRLVLWSRTHRSAHPSAATLPLRKSSRMCCRPLKPQSPPRRQVKEETPLATFEESLKKLEVIVDQLERGDLALEESIKLFEEGVNLSNACKKELETAEGKVQLLLKQRDGSMKAEPFPGTGK